MKENIKSVLSELRNHAASDIEAIDRVSALIDREDGEWEVNIKKSHKETKTKGNQDGN